MSAHRVFVLGLDGKPSTPTTPARARKLLRVGVAKPAWSKFNTFGIQMLVPTRQALEKTALGVDNGTKFEGYSVVVGKENLLNIKLDLPDKKKIVRKMTERRQLRRARRYRNCRRRPKRFDNRCRRNWLAPSQAVIVGSRLKFMRELFRIYPIHTIGFEDVRFNHAAKRWGANFSTVEIGKAGIKEFFRAQGAELYEYQGHQTEELRKRYGYRKTRAKGTDKFTSHYSDSLALAVDVSGGHRIEPGPFLVVNDTYRPVRRRLHDTQFSKGHVRHPYSRGSLFGTRKGILIGLKGGSIGQLCGENRGQYRYYRQNKTRGRAKAVVWMSNHFFTRGGSGDSSAD